MDDACDGFLAIRFIWGGRQYNQPFMDIMDNMLTLDEGMPDYQVI